MVISATDIKIENFKGHKMESNVYNRKIAIDSQELRDKNKKEILHRSRKIIENNEAIIKSDMEKKCCKQDDTVNGNMNKNIIQIREKSRVSVVDLFRKARFQRKLGRVSFFFFSFFFSRASCLYAKILLQITLCLKMTHFLQPSCYLIFPKTWIPFPIFLLL